ncbi:MAG: YitT family protein, partial [SAR324 cluster bacterium]|nr:YitT family protein [SAR324 cluster bacterium]
MLSTLMFGCVVFGFVVNGILLPHNLFATGLTGLALLIYDYVKEYVTFSLLYVILNLPIFIIGFKEFSLKFIITSVIGMVFYSLSL